MGEQTGMKAVIDLTGAGDLGEEGINAVRFPDD